MSSTRFHTIGLHNLVKKSIRPGSKVCITIGPHKNSYLSLDKIEKKKIYTDYSKRIENTFSSLIKDVCLDLESAVYDFPDEQVSLSVVSEGSNLETHHFIYGPHYRDYDNSPCSN